MAQLIGNKTQQPQQPKIDLSQAKEITCQNCGGTIFINGNKFLKIPKISAGTPQDVLIPVEVFLCGDCGELCEELLPKEFKNK
jgi:DNA-directed RNA polymerase subunit RPC12/RpoP